MSFEAYSKGKEIHWKTLNYWVNYLFNIMFQCTFEDVLAYWRVKAELREKRWVQKRDRETSDHGHFAFLSDVKTTNSGKCQSNCHTFSTKGILGNFSGCSVSISIHTSICTDPEAFSCLSPSLSLSVFLPVGCWLFPGDIWGPCVSRTVWYFQLCVIWSPCGSKSTQIASKIAHKLHQIANMLKR